MQADIVTGIYGDSRPTKVGIEKRHLHHSDVRKSLQLISNPAEDQGMSDFFQSPELVGVGEHDPSQQLAVYLAFEDDTRPSFGDRGQSFIYKDRVAHRIGVDSADATRRQ
jgi:hypothetical protein